MVILKDSILTDNLGRTYRVTQIDKGYVYIQTEPPVKGEVAIPIPLSYAESLTVRRAA